MCKFCEVTHVPVILLSVSLPSLTNTWLHGKSSKPVIWAKKKNIHISLKNSSGRYAPPKCMILDLKLHSQVALVRGRTVVKRITLCAQSFPKCIHSVLLLWTELEMLIWLGNFGDWQGSVIKTLKVSKWRQDTVWEENKQTSASRVRPWKYFSLIGWVLRKTYLISGQDNKWRETFGWHRFNCSWKQSQVLNGTLEMLCALWWQGSVACFCKARFASFGAKIK